MNKKDNCWDYMKCGKGPDENGKNKFIMCPVVFHEAANGLNGGVNGGRLCWLVASKKKYGEMKHLNQKRTDPCFFCEFHYKVMAEEGFMKVCETSSHFLSNSPDSN